MNEAIHAMLMRMPKHIFENNKIFYFHEGEDHMGYPVLDYYGHFRNKRTAFSPYETFPPEHLTDEENRILEVTKCYSSDAAEAENEFVKIGIWRLLSCIIYLNSKGLRKGDVIKEIMGVINHSTVNMLIDTLCIEIYGYKWHYYAMTLFSWIYAVIRFRMDNETTLKQVATLEENLKGVQNLVIQKFAEEERVDDLKGQLKESENLLKETDAKRAGAQFEIFRLGNQVNDLEGRVKDDSEKLDEAHLEILRLENEKQESFQEENRVLSSRVRVLEGKNAQLHLSMMVMTDKEFAGRRVTRSNSKRKSPTP